MGDPNLPKSGDDLKAQDGTKERRGCVGATCRQEEPYLISECVDVIDR